MNINNELVYEIVKEFVSSIENEICYYKKPLSKVYGSDDLKDFESMMERLNRVIKLLDKKKPFDNNDLALTYMEEHLVSIFAMKLQPPDNFHFYLDGMRFLSGDWNKRIWSY